MTEAELRQEFETYGPVRQVILIKDRITNKPRGYGFVEFEHSADLKGMAGALLFPIGMGEYQPCALSVSVPTPITNSHPLASQMPTKMAMGKKFVVDA